MSEDIARDNQELQALRLYQAVHEQDAASMGQLFGVVCTASFCLLVGTTVGTFAFTSAVNWRVVLFVGALPFLLLGIGGLVITNQLIAWKVRWWTEFVASKQEEEREPQPEQIRFIRLRERSEIGGVDTCDLEKFVRVIYETHDWACRSWRNKPLPSGRPCHDAYWREMIEVLLKTQILQDYGPRRRGFLMGTQEEALATLHLDLKPPVSARTNS